MSCNGNSLRAEISRLKREQKGDLALDIAADHLDAADALHKKAIAMQNKSAEHTAKAAEAVNRVLARHDAGSGEPDGDQAAPPGAAPTVMNLASPPKLSPTGAARALFEPAKKQ